MLVQLLHAYNVAEGEGMNMNSLHQLTTKGNSQAGFGLWRYFLTLAIVVPMVLFFLACAGEDGIVEPPIDDRICVPWDQSVEVSSSPADILWIIDNSGSMCREQDNLRDGF